MDLAKKMFVYIMVLVGLGITATLVCLSYLFLVPDSTIMDYFFVGGEVQSTTETYTLGAINYNRIDVDTTGFDVTIYPKEGIDEIEVSFLCNAVGVANSEISDFSYTYTYNNFSKVIKIRTQEPTGGLILYNDSNIKIAIPTTSDYKTINIISQGGRIILGDATEDVDSDLDTQILKMDEVSITNTDAEINIKNFRISDSLEITNESGRVNILSDVEGDIVLNSQISSFIFLDEEEEICNIGGNLTVNASNSAIESGNIGGELSYTAANGLLTIGRVAGDVFITSDNCQVEIEEVGNNLSIESEYGNISIDQVGASSTDLYQAYINSENGNVYIDECFIETEIITKQGDVTINDAYYDLDIITEYGDIDVYFNETAENRNTSIVTLEGDINATNIRGDDTVLLQVRSTGLGKITASFLEMKGINTINGGRADVTLLVPLTEYLITATSSTGNLNVVVGDVYRTIWPAELVEDRYYFSGAVSGYELDVDTLIIDTTAGDISLSANIIE